MEQGGLSSLAILQDLCHYICLLFLRKEALRPCLGCRAYVPETLLLYLDSMVSYKPAGESRKEQGVPVSLCISLRVGWGVLASWGQRVELGKLRLSPVWRLRLAKRTGSGPLPPGVLLSPSNLLLFLCGEAGRVGEWASGRAGNPLSRGWGAGGRIG